MWEDLIRKAKDGGLDVIDTYVFWNVHEPSPGNVPTTLESGSSFHWIQFQNSQVPSHTVFFWFVCYFCGVGLQYNFEGRYDLVRFIKTVQRVGLYVHLRIGPYVCAEWNFGYSMHFQLSLVDFFGFLVSMLNHIVWWCNCRGFPVWLKYVPGISFRTDNGPFKVEP